MLDAVIDELSRRPPRTVSVSLSVQRDFTGYVSEIRAASEAGILEARYIAPRPEYAELTRENQFVINAAARAKYGGKQIAEKVGGDVLLSLANCIADREVEAED
jgi:hypothetical protein